MRVFCARGAEGRPWICLDLPGGAVVGDGGETERVALLIISPGAEK